MLTHIVLYKLKPGVTEEQVGTLLRQARTILPRIPGAMNIRAGTSIYHDDPYQCALVMYFDNVEALDKYRVHPTHVKFLEEVVKPLVDEVRRLDYVDD
jgi:hypothetical protein